jgi:Flp pilus assembly protein TadG
MLTSRSGSKSSSTRRGERRGVAAVEFAVIAPLFLLLLGGIIEFGQAFRIQHMLSTAARRGARASIVEGATNSQVREKVIADCVRTLGVSDADVTVTSMINGSSDGDLSQAREGTAISITVDIPFTKAGVGFFASMFSNSTLSSTCTLEHE